MKSLDLVLAKYNSDPIFRRWLRLGQWFVNRYIKKPWPELFYEEDTQKAIEMISQYLIDHQYVDDLPPEVR